MGAELWRACTEEDLVQGWDRVGIGPMERMGSSVPGRGNSRRQGRETGKHLSLARRKFVGGFLEGNLLGPDWDPHTLQTSPGWLQLTRPQKLL